ncbi:ribosomal protein L13 [Desulfarculus baarsii DSM 2075]|uniref:Large ribosomal subunit protein uL13 n=1 Tax=Desulfarculus baarsii (strain ATCC 33931 / DSM 2075 / LMG 7858 / VKM B-1802 / 2st14) TaxID=644282 RepID=E1QF54_DESB2|nr:50S ribosomal protein L13 [Desulfarculus baarsii]ADK84190.1 ribosomal protein L13 [Desulfarculus baarsii DSM 2075]
MKTFVAKPNDATREWFVIDATDLVLGRMATQIAMRLRGKHKPTFTPHVDTGDFIIVVNADKVKLTGRKWDQKKYYRHSGYPGGITEISADKARGSHPERLIFSAVRGMLPKNTLGRQMLKKLKVYAGPEHPHQAQTPQSLSL